MRIYRNPKEVYRNCILGSRFSQSFKQTACEDFFRGADSWLIAKALSTNAIVVTHEKLEPNCIRRVPIPNVCKAFGVTYIDILELVRKTGVRFGIR